MTGALFRRLVRGDGTLDANFAVDREVLYRSPSGKAVERFALKGGPAGGTFIYKPLTNVDLADRESWAHRNLLPRILLDYPRLLAASENLDPDRSWSVHEDLGPLSHVHDASVLIRAARAIRRLHRVPADSVPESFTAQKPGFTEVREIVRKRGDELKDILTRLGMPPTESTRVLDRLVGTSDALADEKVVCHGDLHAGNVAERNGSVVILDWEHVHLNSMFWDLYNLLDMTHPIFRRIMTSAIRLEALDGYLTERRAEGWDGDAGRFVQDYHDYAAVYSAWMLLLIAQDTRSGRWDPEGLAVQERETYASLTSCVRWMEEETEIPR